jgi:hypothetical protein
VYSDRSFWEVTRKIEAITPTHRAPATFVLQGSGITLEEACANCDAHQKDSGIEEWHSPESIRAAAQHCHEMNRTWCALRGDTSQVGWDDAPEWQRESAIEGVKFHLANPHAGPSGSHENWMRHKLADGWVYGPQKDPEKKTHPCLVPYAELSADQRAKDAFFVATLHALFPEVFEPPQLTWTE